MEAKKQKKQIKIEQKAVHKAVHGAVKATPKESSREEGISKIRMGIAIAVLVILVLLIAFYDRIIPSGNGFVAIINGEKITEKEFNSLYSKIPEMYVSMGLTEEKFLNDTLIPHKLLLQEAAKRGIVASDAEVDSMIEEVITASGTTKDQLIEDLKGQNTTYDEFRSMAKEQLAITKLLNETVKEMQITDAEINEFYNSNKQLFATSNTTYASIGEVKDRIEPYLANKKLLDGLRDKADIKIFLGDGSAANIVGQVSSSGQTVSGMKESFMETSNEICKQDGKPLVVLFSTTSCPHCKWIKGTFDSVAKEYAASGKIAAYHLEMDSGDNTLTSGEESSIPDQLADLFWKYSQNGGVPTFVFGCKYYRIGNAHESGNDLAQEESDFRAVLDALVAESSGSAGASSSGEG